MTNWVESKAQVRPRLSVRGARPRRTGGRASRSRQGVSLADQDRPMSNEEGWVPADEHERTRGHDDEYEDITDDEHQHTHHLDEDRHSRHIDDEREIKSDRGRDERRLVADE